MVADIPCNDVSGTIGITGTPVIDDQTDTVYFYTKTYAGTQNGVHNGRYLFHALDINTLDERAGFPRDMEGSVADNDATRYFTGGAHLQRPSLSLINNIVYAGFGGHCDLVCPEKHAASLSRLTRICSITSLVGLLGSTRLQRR